MFNPPMDHCPVCKQLVALNQTRAECRAREGCGSSVECPLKLAADAADSGHAKRAGDDPFPGLR